MENAIQEISQGNIYWIILLALIGYLLLSGIKKFIPFLLKNAKNRKTFRYLMPLVELAFWMVITIKAIPAFYACHYLLGIAIFALSLSAGLWFSWYQLREYAAGAVIRFNPNIKLHETIEIDGIQGQIKAFYSDSLLLENEKGESIILPYTTIAGKRITKQHFSNQVKSFRFTITTRNTVHPAMQIAGLKQFILRQPWSSVNKDPQINFIDTTNQGHLYEITVYTPGNSYATKIKEEVQKTFGIME
ncbi:MAG: hypothetical protein PHU97_09450 [Bacteroidales bacterium]|nr:hypothetical protein [Bacteroidales bacterium]MDD3961755.1 hypothetical protein [Bacteroidales bacterium]MDY0285125.1 hypothetical protein [Bacteroidales bacterium]HPE86564.1 hypothetical protein [Bacteroidales bacterium]